MLSGTLRWRPDLVWGRHDFGKSRGKQAPEGSVLPARKQGVSPAPTRTPESLCASTTATPAEVPAVAAREISALLLNTICPPIRSTIVATLPSVQVITSWITVKKSVMTSTFPLGTTKAEPLLVPSGKTLWTAVSPDVQAPTGNLFG